MQKAGGEFANGSAHRWGGILMDPVAKGIPNVHGEVCGGLEGDIDGAADDEGGEGVKQWQSWDVRQTVE